MRPEKLDKRKARIVARLAAERRHFVRGKLEINGRFLAASNREYPCQIIDISPGGLSIQSDFLPQPSEKIVLMMEHLGRVQAEVVRELTGGFAACIMATSRKRNQLASELTWLMNAERLGLQDDRAGPRNPHQGDVHVQLHDSTRFIATAVDISATGIALESTEKVSLGEPVTIGRLQGTVSRKTGFGFAVKFDPPDEQVEDV
ncbi:MAG: PilZ domain-containing protein [Robiginitomaculum sp.]|nr:PilZ domain-containing protein [Robiginitomaculum sp.]